MKAELTGNKLNKESGVLTMELLIAFGILFLVIPSVIYVVFGNQSVRIDVETNNEALYKAKHLLETARANSELDFNLVNPTNTVEVSEGLTYTKQLSVEQVDLWTKKVVSTISWDGEHGRTPQVQLTTLLTNPEAVNGGDTCSSVLEGDWSRPQKTEYELGADLLGDPSSGFPVSSVQAFNERLYVTVDNTHGNNDHTFFVIDISNAPEIEPSDVLGSLDNNASVRSGLNAVAVDGESHAYAANAIGTTFGTCVNVGGTNPSCGQLQVIDLNTLTVIYTFKVPGVTGSGGQGKGKSIFYKDGIVYLGLASDPTGQEFVIIDVGGGSMGGSPTSPVLMDSVEIGNDVNSIQVNNNFAYVASPNNIELQIFNVSDGTNVIPAGSYNSSTGGGHGKSIYLQGNKLFLGKTVPNAGKDFHILNNSNPTSALTELGGIESSSSVNGLVVRDYLAFLITSDGQFLTYRIDNPSNITQYASPLTLPPGTGNVNGAATDCEGNYLFVGSQKTSGGGGGQDKGYISVITGG